MFANDSLCYITNLISLRHLPSKKERNVWHLQYTGWPDHGCPDDMYGFLGRFFITYTIIAFTGRTCITNACGFILSILFGSE